MVIHESFETTLYWRSPGEKPLSWAEVLEQEHLSLPTDQEVLQDLIRARDAFERERSEKLIRILDAGIDFIKTSLGANAQTVIEPRPSALLETFLALVQDAGAAYRALTPGSSAQAAWHATDQVILRGPALETGLRAHCNHPESAESFCQALRRFLADLEMSFRSDEAWMSPLLEELAKAKRTALCLSGGGIRSASFSLGIIQALSRLGLLKRFDYLSTVSGGGFTGGWLSAWIHREQGDAARVEQELANHEPKWAGNPKRYAHGPEPAWEAPPLWRLRVNSNYLAPRLGIFSADIWTLVALVMRNCLVHWMVLVPMVLTLLTVPRMLQATMSIHPKNNLALTAGALMLLVAFIIAFRERPQHRQGSGDSRIIALFVLSLTALSGLLLTWEWGSFSAEPGGGRWMQALGCMVFSGMVGALSSLKLQWGLSFLKEGFRKGLWVIPLCTLIGAGFAGIRLGDGLCGLGFGAGIGAASGLLATVVLSLLAKDSLALAHLAFLLGAMIGGIGWGIWSYGSQWVGKGYGEIFTLIGLPLVFLIAFLCTSFVVVVGSRWKFSGQAMIDNADREWFARLGAWSFIFSGAWIAFSGISLFGPRLVIGAPTIYTLLTSTTLGAALMGVLSSRSRGQKNEGGTSRISYLPTLGGLVGSLLILVGLSVALDWVLSSPAVPATTSVVETSIYTRMKEGLRRQHREAVSEPAPGAVRALWTPLQTRMQGKPHFRLVRLGILFAIGAGLMLFFAWLFPLQEFSLHALYRNRLIRAYLGASRKNRDADPFTGFSYGDDLPMTALTQRPFHIVNVALNQVFGEKLAWQERKASSFTISPLHCGTFFQLGYRPSAQYGGGISVGTAMTISGAAANPNMGYHSSPLLAFTMTFFAVRLGTWLGNPGLRGQNTYTRPGPFMTLGPVLTDTFGLATATHPYINLSDGGHFENLGLYEMVARRCRLIVVCDAGADPEFRYEDLGNAIRKIRIDHGIPIQLHQELPCKCTMESSDPDDTPRIVKGTIQYSVVDGGDPKQDGLLIYIKTHLWNAVPADIRTYALNHDAFPHEGTSDQFFSESQFESYRALGEAIVLKATPDAFDSKHAEIFEWAAQLRVAQP